MNNMIQEAIRAHRKQLGLSQTEFGKRYGVSHAAVSQWETGATESSYKVIEEALAAVTPCPQCKGTGYLSK